MKVIDASLGFKGFLWRVSRGSEVKHVYACDNYTAAEACGWTFAGCVVTEVKATAQA